jgi:hypothetical protein
MQLFSSQGIGHRFASSLHVIDHLRLSLNP